MVYAYTQDVPIDAGTYRRIMAGIGVEPMDGLLVHLCTTRPEGGLRYTDVWESEEQCARAFHARIHPAVEAVLGGARPAVEPVVLALDVVDLTGALVPHPA